MRFNTSGDAATGTSTVGVNGATPAALVGVTGGSKFGPGWLTATKILFQNVTAGAILQSYDIVSLATATVDAAGQNDLAAGNAKWGRFLSGSGVKTNIGVGPFATAALGDVSTDHGELAITLNYPSGPGITVYSSAGATLLSLPAVNAGPIIRIRGHLMAYSNVVSPVGWHMANVIGGSSAFAPRLNENINWITPVTTTSGKVLVLERSDRLTLRYADSAQGWILVAPGTNTFNPDVMEFSSGVVRVGWASNQGETPDSLTLIDITLATGATRNGVIGGGIIVWTTGPTLARTTFTVGPVEGSNQNGALYPPFKHPVQDAKTGLMTVPWQRFEQAISDSVTGNTSAIASIPPVSVPSAFSTIASPGQNPIVANGPTTLNVVGGATIDNLTNTITIAGSGGTVTHTSGALTINQLVIGNAAADIKVLGTLGTTTTLLHGNAAGAPTFGAVSLTADVTGRLAYANFVASTAASRLLGRTSGSAGDWQEVSLGTGLALTGTVLDVTGTSYTKTVVTVTNAQIKTLPSIPILLVAAPAGGFRVKPLTITMNFDTTAGAYVGVDPVAATLSIQTTAGAFVATSIDNDSSFTIPLASVTHVLGTGTSSYFDLPTPNLIPITGTTDGETEYTQPEVNTGGADFDGLAVQLAFDNNGSATALTGGNVANSLKITLVYTIEAI